MATGNPYVPVSISGYDVTPPTDDGAQTDNNTVEWDKHKTKLGDPIKTGVESTQTAITAALDQRLLNSIDGKTGNYTVLSTDRGKILSFTGSSASTFTLLAAATAKLGFELVVRNFGTAVLTVDGSAAETVDGVASVDLFPGQKIWLQCDGTNWVVASDSLRPGVVPKTNTDSPYAVLVDDNGRVIDVDASGGAVTINLPAAATAKNGFTVSIVKTDSSANAITVDGDGTETVNGALTLTIGAQYRVVELICDATEWFVRSGGGSTAFDSDYLHVRDEKTLGTAGGTFTSGAWQTRDLNTVETNEITGASLATNQITLPAGTYYVKAKAPASQVALHQTRLQDITGAATLITGQSATTTSSASSDQNNSILEGRFTLSVESDIELQHRCSITAATGGFGRACSFTIEVYAVVEIWKVG